MPIVYLFLEFLEIFGVNMHVEVVWSDVASRHTTRTNCRQESLTYRFSGYWKRNFNRLAFVQSLSNAIAGDQISAEGFCFLISATKVFHLRSERLLLGVAWRTHFSAATEGSRGWDSPIDPCKSGLQYWPFGKMTRTHQARCSP